jgi:Spy/CpxP family protein refolding chaperone
MKKKMTLALAASILALTVSAFPHQAVASSTTSPSTSDSQLVRKSGGSNLLYVQVILAAGSLLSALLP